MRSFFDPKELYGTGWFGHSWVMLHPATQRGRRYSIHHAVDVESTFWISKAVWISKENA